MIFGLGIIGIAISIVLALAIIPAVVLMIYVYKKDKVEKEPVKLLLQLLGLGVLAAVAAAILEAIGEFILYGTVPDDLPVYPVLYAFLVVAVAEEGMKFLLMKKRTWKDPAFDYKFDAIVYAAFVSLGFAAFENIFYVIQYGFSTAVVRAFISIPGHLAFSVVMGYFYGFAKQSEQMLKNSECTMYLWISFISSALLHGFFDACLMLENVFALIIFFIFIIIFYSSIFRLIKKEAKYDHIIISSTTQALNEKKLAIKEAEKAGVSPLTFHQMNYYANSNRRVMENPMGNNDTASGEDANHVV